MEEAANEMVDYAFKQKNQPCPQQTSSTRFVWLFFLSRQTRLLQLFTVSLHRCYLLSILWIYGVYNPQLGHRTDGDSDN